MGCLYSIQSPSGKVYIGITSRSAEERFQAHWESAGGAVSLIKNALRKYGREACTLTELVYSDDWEVLCTLEKDYIKHFNTKSPNGYNMTDGGDGSVGLKWNEEQRRHMSEVLRGNKYATGCQHTEDGLRRMKESLLGNRRAANMSVEGRARIACSMISRHFSSSVTEFSYYDAQFVVGHFSRLMREFV